MKLEIVVITYNRSGYLKQTLSYLMQSCLKDYPITVLNNASTDDTEAVVNIFTAQYPNLKLVSHKNNIGLGANIVRALEWGSAPYTWVVCDDDTLDLSQFEDVLQVIEEEKVDLIHIGGHNQPKWSLFGGKTFTPAELLKKRYPYYKFCSFLPTNIFKTALLQKNYLIPAYANVVNAYPHMPYLFDIYKTDRPVYISQHQNVTAKEDGQSYSRTTWFFWWMRTCELLKDPAEVRAAFFDQWNDIEASAYEWSFREILRFKQAHNKDEYVRYFFNRYFTRADKMQLQKRKIKNTLKRLLNKPADN